MIDQPIQDAGKDPYDNLKKKAENAPKQGDIVSGIFPGQKASEGPQIVDQHGAIMETPSGKERREMRQQQKRMKAAQYIFEIETDTVFFDDDGEEGACRMCWVLVSQNVENKIRTTLAPFTYSKDDLQGFVDILEGKDVELQKIEIVNKPFTFTIVPRAESCEDGINRMMFEILQKHEATPRDMVLIEFGYTIGQLGDFINAIEAHEVEIQEEKLKAGSSEEPPETADAS